MHFTIGLPHEAIISLNYSLIQIFIRPALHGLVGSGRHRLLPRPGRRRGVEIAQRLPKRAPYRQIGFANHRIHRINAPTGTMCLERGFREQFSQIR